MNRIKYLDGFRGIAILLVVFYHAYSRWSNIVPYGNTIASFPIFKLGWIGVELFFLISGFVILMTLDKSKNLKEFILKRWLRLFPAMFITTILIYLTASFLPERPAGQPKLLDTLSGLLFIEPYWFYKFAHLNITTIEGAFWSLFVEVKYYIIFGILYFIFSKNKAINIIFGLYCLVSFLAIFYQYYNTNTIFYAITLSNLLSLNHLGWFATGSCIYLYIKENNKKYLYKYLFFGIISSFILPIYYKNEIQSYTEISIAALLVIFLFGAGIIYSKTHFILENKILNYFAFISYPLYLIHENAMIALIIKANKLIPNFPSFLWPIIIISFITIIAYYIAKYLEPPLGNFLKKLIFHK